MYRLRCGFASGLALSLCFSFSIAQAQFGPLSECNSTEIGGVVFRDYNGNGVRDVLEPGLAGILVTAFDSSNTTINSTTTSLDGTYQLTTGSVALRVEFGSIPQYLLPGASGVSSVTTVAFPQAGDCSVSLALSAPSEHCEDNPDLSVAYQTQGDALGGGSAGTTDAYASFAYNSDGNPSNGTAPLPKFLAKNSEIGSVWGAAYQRSTKRIFTGALMKRHAGFGPLGTGGIYQIDVSADPATVSQFLDLQTLGVNTGIDPRTLPGDPGLPAAAGARSFDPNAFAMVGKIGLGDIEISADEKTLWVVNLFDKTLYALNIGLPAVTPDVSDLSAYPVPNPGCSNDDYMPWAVKEHDGVLYIGVVCTAESSQNSADLHAYVMQLNSGIFSNIFDLNLDYTKGYVSAPSFQAKPTNGSNWHPWARDMQDIYPVQFAFADINYPQPILANIEFDVDNSMILGFMDRSGNQFAMQQASPHNPQSTVGFASGGDMLRACALGSNLWVLENNASCPGHAPTLGAGNNQGPGGGEYYFDDRIPMLFQGVFQDVHRETALGSLVYKPGEPEVVGTFFDVFSLISGGILVMDNEVGSYLRGYQLYNRNKPGNFGKAVGLGDLELLCEAAPCEIGNRVWLDSNADGVQDAGEVGIPGVTLSLRDGISSQVVASTVTAEDGTYIFNRDSGVECGKSYTLQADNSADFGSGGVLNTLILTPQDAAEDQRDSDATLINGVPTINLTTGVAGANDHTFDIGFTLVECENVSFFAANAQVDGSSQRLSELVTEALRHRGKKLSHQNNCSNLSVKKQKTINQEAQSLHLQLWGNIWSFGSETQSCETELSTACISTDVSGVLSAVTTDSEKLYSLVSESFKGCKANSGKRKRIEKEALQEIKALRVSVEEIQKLNPLIACP